MDRHTMSGAIVSGHDESRVIRSDHPGNGKRVIAPVGVIRPMWPISLNHRLPSGPLTMPSRSRG